MGKGENPENKLEGLSVREVIIQSLVVLFLVIFYIYVNNFIKLNIFLNNSVFSKNNFLLILLFLITVIILLIFLKNKKKDNGYIIYKIIIKDNKLNKNILNNYINFIYNILYNNINEKDIIFFLVPKEGIFLCVSQNDEAHKLIKIIEKAAEHVLTLQKVTHVEHCINSFKHKGGGSLGLESEFFSGIYLNEYVNNHNITGFDLIRSHAKPAVKDSGNIVNVIRLGFFYNERDEPEPLYLPFTFFRVHTGIFGITGSGKTTTAAVIAGQIAKHSHNVIVIDWHGEYRSLLSKQGAVYIDVSKGELPVNPLDSKDLESVANIFGDIFDLSSPQLSVFMRLVRKKKLSSLDELATFLEGGWEGHSYWDKELRYAILRKIEFVIEGEGTSLFREDYTGKIPKGLVILDVSGIKSIVTRKLYVLTIIRTIFERASSKQYTSHDKPVFIFVDEAHNILPKNETNFISKVLSESRKFNVFLYIVTQSPSSINPDYLKNLGNKIVHAIRFPSDLKILEEVIVKDTDLIATVPFMRPGEFIASLYNVPFPIKGYVDRRILLGQHIP